MSSKMHLQNLFTVTEEEYKLQFGEDSEDDLDDDLVVRGGVMLRLPDWEDDHWKPVNRFYVDVDESKVYQDSRPTSTSDDVTSPTFNIFL